MADTDKTVTATKTSLRIVESLKRLDGTGVTDVAKELELPKSTVHNHLATLAEGGYVTRRDGEHRIGLRFLELGKHTRNAMKLYELAQPEIVSLADETGELSNAAVEEHGEGSTLPLPRGQRCHERYIRWQTRHAPLYRPGKGDPLSRAQRAGRRDSLHPRIATGDGQYDY